MPETDETEWPPHLDALVAAPANHRLLFEDDAVRVLEAPAGPIPGHPRQQRGLGVILTALLPNHQKGSAPYWSKQRRQDELFARINLVTISLPRFSRSSP